MEQARYWPHNRIIWAGPNETPPALVALAADLDRLLEPAGFRTEARRFAAHVTLIRKARAPGALPSLPAVDWPVEEIALVRSHLSSSGPDYEVLQRYALT